PVIADKTTEPRSEASVAESTVSAPEKEKLPEQAARTQNDAQFGRQMLTPIEETVIITPPADDEVLALYQVQVDSEPMRIQEPAVKTVTPDRPGVDRDEVQQLWREMNEQ